MNKVVARFADGRVLKGTTADFFAAKELFHLAVAVAPAGTEPIEIRTADLKALFFVKDLMGNPGYVERKEFDPEHPPAGRRIKVTFADGEVLVDEGGAEVVDGNRPGHGVDGDRLGHRVNGRHRADPSPSVCTGSRDGQQLPSAGRCALEEATG